MCRFCHPSGVCIDRCTGGRKLRTEADNLIIGEAQADKFMEYVDVEGVVQPILTIKINAREAGSVERIVAEEGTMMEKGDTILTLTNPDLIRTIDDQRDEWEKQLSSFQEKEIEMEQKSLDLQKQTLQTILMTQPPEKELRPR